MGRPTSSPPAGSSDPESERPPAWFDEVISSSGAEKSRRRRSLPDAGVFVTARHSGPIAMPSGTPLDPMRVGEEQRGRYTYVSPDGEAGAELGRGGIGRVLVVMDEHLGREVAIKELLPLSPGSHREDPEMASRFLAEARITGQLEHPNIVPVYELGRRLDGRLYYAMRVVRGETMSAALERASSLTERLSLLPHFAGLCNAIAYAHSRGVVHRDIKPDNVMIGEFGETVVLDWGIAKVQGAAEQRDARAPRGVDLVGETSDGDVVGTPLYMSPEQAGGQIDEVDESTDVWALGVVLYQLLCGRLPFAGKSSEEVVRRVLRGRRASVQRLEPLAPSELAAVAEHALQRDKSLRYSSVRDLAQDIDAFMSGARVAAYDYSALELFRRFYRKHRAAALVGMVALFSLLVVALDFQRRVLRARDRALSAEEKALEKERTAVSSLAEVFAERSVGAVSEGDVVGAALYGARALELGERADARGSLVSETNQPVVVPTVDHPEFGDCQRFAAARFGAVACSRGGEVRTWSPDGRVHRWGLAAPARHLALSGDGRRLLVVRNDGGLSLHDRVSGKPLASPPLRLPDAELVRLSDDGSRLAVTEAGGRTVLRDAATGRPLGETRLSQPVSSLAFSADGRELLLGGRLGLVALWSPESGLRAAVQGHRGTVTAVAFSPHGDRVATAASDRTLALFRTADLARLAPALRDVGTVQCLGWSPDGRWLVAGTDDRMLGLVDVWHPGRMRRFRGHPAPLSVARFSQASTIVSASRDHGLRVWRHDSARLPRLLPARGNVLAQAFRGSGVLATAGLPQYGVCLWDLARERCTATLPVRRGQVRALAIDEAHQRLALGTSEGRIMIWDLATALPERVLSDGEGQVRCLEFDGDGSRLLSASRDRGAVLWDVASGTVQRRFAVDAPLSAAVLDVERGRAVLATRRGTVEAWALDGTLEKSVGAASDWVMDLALHAPSDRLVSTGDDGRITFFRLSTLEVLGSAPASEGRALSVALSPDGRLAATAGEDGLVVLWSVADQRRVAVLPHHRGIARSVEFSPDGGFLASGGDDASVRLWDLSRLGQSGSDALAEAEARYSVRLDGAKLELRTLAPEP